MKPSAGEFGGEISRGFDLSGENLFPITFTDAPPASACNRSSCGGFAMKKNDPADNLAQRVFGLVIPEVAAAVAVILYIGF